MDVLEKISASVLFQQVGSPGVHIATLSFSNDTINPLLLLLPGRRPLAPFRDKKFLPIGDELEDPFTEPGQISAFLPGCLQRKEKINGGPQCSGKPQFWSCCPLPLNLLPVMHNYPLLKPFFLFCHVLPVQVRLPPERFFPLQLKLAKGNPMIRFDFFSTLEGCQSSGVCYRTTEINEYSVYRLGSARVLL